MIYLDNGATSFPKLPQVKQAVTWAMNTCANPGRGGHEAAMAAARTVYKCREKAGALFQCDPEQVVFTANCTHGLNIAIHSLVKPGARVAVSGFDHNAVTRPLYGLGVSVLVAGRKLFDRNNTLEEFEEVLRSGVDAAVFTHVSNVFGYILPVEEMAKLCKMYGVPFIIDAAQSAGILPVKLGELGANFIAMSGHKGLLGPHGTGILLCGSTPVPWMRGGTGSESIRQDMPEYLPDRVEAGTLNVAGIAGLSAGLDYLRRIGVKEVYRREHRETVRCAEGLRRLGFRVFSGEDQAGTVSFVPPIDCEDAAQILSRQGVAVRAGLHCAPLAHESAGTLDTGTVRVSFGHTADIRQTQKFLQAAARLRL